VRERLHPKVSQLEASEPKSSLYSNYFPSSPLREKIIELGSEAYKELRQVELSSPEKKRVDHEIDHESNKICKEVTGQCFFASTQKVQALGIASEQPEEKILGDESPVHTEWWLTSEFDNRSLSAIEKRKDNTGNSF
jgi:hypothetical protein